MSDMARRIRYGLAAVLMLGAGLATVPATPQSTVAICGSVGGRFVDVSGCTDPLYELNDALPPPGAPPPPPGVAPPPPPPPLPNVNVCVGGGRRIHISGCF